MIQFTQLQHVYSLIRWQMSHAGVLKKLIHLKIKNNPHLASLLYHFYHYPLKFILKKTKNQRTLFKISCGAHAALSGGTAVSHRQQSCPLSPGPCGPLSPAPPTRYNLGFYSRTSRCQGREGTGININFNAVQSVHASLAGERTDRARFCLIAGWVGFGSAAGDFLKV